MLREILAFARMTGNMLDILYLKKYINTMKNMYVYIMTNHKQGTLYVGVTNDLIRRVYEHKKKLIKGFTSRYNIDKLMYYEVYDDETTAISREKQLKKSYRKTKEQLINSMNPQWKDLYNDII